MTEQEAIKEFEERLAITDYRDNIPKCYEAMELAVNDMKEVQKCRAIGALDELNSLIAQSAQEFNMLIEYISIGTVEECRAAVEKQKEMIAYCDENDCSDCHFHNTSQKYNKCMNDFIANEIVKGGGVNER